MNVKPGVDVSELKRELFKLCDQNETGTFFIANSDNHSGQIVLKHGKIIALSFGSNQGEHAIPLLLNPGSCHFSFSKNLILPLPEMAMVESGDDALEQFGYQPVQGKGESAGLVRTYRGQIIRDNKPKSAHNSQDNQTKEADTKRSKKAVRIYPGQVLGG